MCKGLRKIFSISCNASIRWRSLSSSSSYLEALSSVFATLPNTNMDTNRNYASCSPFPPAHLPALRTSCDLCKRMKVTCCLIYVRGSQLILIRVCIAQIKCERRRDSCENCIDRGSKCETTFAERKKRQVQR